MVFTEYIRIFRKLIRPIKIMFPQITPVGGSIKGGPGLYLQFMPV